MSAPAAQVATAPQPPVAASPRASGPRPAPAAGLVELLVLRVGEDHYAVDIMRVQEVLRPQPLAPVRAGPPYLLGVLAVRDAVVPVIDLRARLGLPAADVPTRRIVVATVAQRTVGLVVDQVTEVLRVAPAALRPPPAALPPAVAPFFLGLCATGGARLVLLDLHAVAQFVPEAP